MTGRFGQWGVMTGRAPSMREFIALGSTIVGSVVAGLVIGVLLDRHFDTTPTFSLIGVAVGIVGAGATMYAAFRRLPKQ